MKLFKTALIVGGCIVLLSSSAGRQAAAQAQTANPVILTWEAKNFYPADFSGKPIPTSGTPVTASLELVSGGKLANLSSTNIVWYLDNAFIGEGTGKKSVQFVASRVTEGKHTVRARLEREGGTLEASIQIPVARPQLVIEIPHLENTISRLEEATLEAVPYFFTNNLLSDLVFSWQVNTTRQNTAGNNLLTIKIGGQQSPGQSLYVSATAQNQRNLSDFANTRVKLLIE